MRTAIAMTALLALAAPAAAWQFSLEREYGMFVGELSGRSGRSLVVARCFADDPAGRELTVSLDAGLDGPAPDGPVDVSFSSVAGSVTVPMEMSGQRRRLLLYGWGDDAARTIGLLGRSPAGIEVSVLGATFPFTDRDGPAAVLGFGQVCASLPRP